LVLTELWSNDEPAAAVLAVVVAVTSAEEVWAVAVTRTVVILAALFVAVDFALTAKVEVPDWPGLSEKLIGATVDGVLKFALFESLTTPKMKVVEEHAAVSLFVTVTV